MCALRVAGNNDPKELGKYSCPLPFPTQSDCKFALYKGFAGDTVPMPAGEYEREYIALAHTMIASSSCGLSLTTNGEWRMQCVNESALVDHLQEQDVAMYSICMCDPERNTCVHPDIVNAILSEANAGIIAAVLTALPAGVVFYYMLVVRSSGPVIFTLINQAADLFLDVFYACRSQYGSLALLNVHLILLVSALLPYLSIIILSGRALRAPEHHGAYARLHITLSPQSKPRAALAAFCNALSWCIVYLFIGPLLWKAEILIMPAPWSWLTGDEAPPAAADSTLARGGASSVAPAATDNEAAYDKKDAAADDDVAAAEEPSTKGVFNAQMYHIRVLSSWLLQALPMVIVQCLNNNKLTQYGVDGWDTTARISLASSAIACATGLFTLLQQLRKHGLALSTWDMPSLDTWKETVKKIVGIVKDCGCFRCC